MKTRAIFTRPPNFINRAYTDFKSFSFPIFADKLEMGVTIIRIISAETRRTTRKQTRWGASIRAPAQSENQSRIGRPANQRSIILP